MKEYLFKLEMETRDSECDIQGVVNNARYLNYLEATRHKWLQSKGESFAALHSAGIDMVVSSIEIKYKTPLRGMEAFVSCLNVRRDGARFVFEQDIYRMSDLKLCVCAEVSTVCLKNGVLSRGEKFTHLISE